MTEFRQLLKRYLAGEFSQNEWRNIVRSIINRRGLAGQ
jgi:hypothetical protein